LRHSRKIKIAVKYVISHFFPCSDPTGQHWIYSFFSGRKVDSMRNRQINPVDLINDHFEYLKERFKSTADDHEKNILRKRLINP
jgi:hypothetical protein